MVRKPCLKTLSKNFVTNSSDNPEASLANLTKWGCCSLAILHEDVMFKLHWVVPRRWRLWKCSMTVVCYANVINSVHSDIKMKRHFSLCGTPLCCVSIRWPFVLFIPSQGEALGNPYNFRGKSRVYLPHPKSKAWAVLPHPCAHSCI